MRVAFDHQAFSGQRVGGVSRYVVALARGLRQFPEIDVSVLAGIHQNDYARSIESLDLRGRFVPALRGTNRLRSFVNLCWTRWRLRRERVDVVHETFYRRGPAYNSRVRTVVTVHDCIHFLYPAENPFGFDLREALKESVARADLVICVSNNTRTDLLRFTDVSPEKTKVIHLGVTELPGQSVEHRPRSRPYFLFVGKRAGYKNFEVIARALAHSSLLRGNFDIVCFGGGPISRKERNDFAQDGGRAECLIGASEQTDSGLAALYRGATALLYPSLYEGFGLPPLEAMSMGCPVICGDQGSLPEITGDAALQFAPKDPGMLANRMEVVQNPSIRRRLVDRGLEQCRRFSWRKCVEQTLGEYRNLMK